MTLLLPLPERLAAAGTDADRRQRQVFGLFAEVELFLKSVDSVLTGPQQAQFGIGPKSKAKAKKLVSALKDLQWLPEAVPRDGK